MQGKSLRKIKRPPILESALLNSLFSGYALSFCIINGWAAR
jgi:hypothetical protein